MKFEIYQSKSKSKSQKWWWRVVSRNGKVTAGSVEGFSSPSKAIRSIKKLMDDVSAFGGLEVWKGGECINIVYHTL